MAKAEIHPGNLRKRRLMEYLKQYPDENNKSFNMEENVKKIKVSATSTPIVRKRKSKNKEIVFKFEANENGMVEIGPNGTMIAEEFLLALNWSFSGAAVTRKILTEVFGRETLACHSLTGKPSPAFVDCEKPLKPQLDPIKAEDIINCMLNHTNLTEKEIRNAITTKCADENRQRRKSRSL